MRESELNHRTPGRNGRTCRGVFRHVLPALLALTLLLGGCGKEEEARGPEKVSLRLNEAQMLLIASSERKRTEELYTDRIWQVEVGDGGRTYEEAFGDRMKEFFIELEAMDCLAEAQGLKIQGEERKRLDDAAAAFYETSVAGTDLADRLSRDDTAALFRDYALALAERNAMMSDRRAEVSESEAKVIRVQQIITDDPAAAEKALERAQSGGDFYALAQTYSRNRSIQVRLTRGELPQEAEDAVFRLNDGELSGIVQAGGLYYIFKCIDAYDEKETALRRQTMQEERLRTVVSEAFEDWCDGHSVEIDSQIFGNVLETAKTGSYQGEDFFAAVKAAAQ